MKTFKTILIASAAIVAISAGLSDASAQSRLWGTYYGGMKHDGVNAITTNRNVINSPVYIVGSTKSSDQIATPDAFDASKAPSQTPVTSGYLVKLDSNGKRVWGTYYGDGSEANLFDVKLDSSGNVYVLGTVRCPSQGLATPGAIQASCQGDDDLYLAKFDAGGHRLWGTYYGGSGDDVAASLVVTPSAVYAVGWTASTSGIASSPSADANFGGGLYDGFVAKFDLAGKRLWGRYYGGEGDFDRIWDIACRSRIVADGSVQDDCIVVGDTDSESEIATPGAHDITGDSQEAFIARLNGRDGQTIWGTYYGGESGEWAVSLVLDSNLNIYVGGGTYSQDGLATDGAFKTHAFGSLNNFLAKFGENGNLIEATYFGEEAPGSWNEVLDLTSDGTGNVYVLGEVDHTLPGVGTQATPNAFDKTVEVSEATITKFDKSLNRIWSTYYGGSGIDVEGESFFDSGIAVGSDNSIYVAGATSSPQGMVTQGAHKTELQEMDGFVVKFLQGIIINP